MGSAYGDLSSERAIIRLEKMICEQSGVYITSKIAGQIFGSDGLNGVKGTVVATSSKHIKNAAIGGLISGVAGAAKGQDGFTISGAGLIQTKKKGAKSLAKSKIGKSLAKTAFDTAVASAGASGYVPPSVAKALGKEAKKKVAGMGIFDTIKKGAKSLAKSKIGKSLAKTAIDTAVASAGASGYVPPSVAKSLGKSAKSSVDGYGIWTGGGDHSGGFGGMGLYAGRRTYGGGMMGGALLNVSNSHLPPALQSQNLSANFAFRNQLPPALAQMK